ncbi:hypothetical protein ACSQ76_15015 [Roseovarius sp. B08]|uniref:hypothetical protein n=1 Tax=Roseovarius sp. B08 TaxID=3449223 RepID=UPI003EDBFB13
MFELAQPLALLLLPLPWLVQRFMAARSVGGRALVLPRRVGEELLARARRGGAGGQACRCATGRCGWRGRCWWWR